MKKIFAIFLCGMLLCATPIVAFAEEETSDPVVEAVIPETEEAAPETEEKSMTEEIVDYVKAHIEEFSVIGTLLGMVVYEIRKHGKLNGSIGLLNNNAIAVATNSANAVKEALGKFDDISKTIKEGQKATEATLAHVENVLKTAKASMLELSNEVAELLVLANIPNSKKDELYARHTKAVHDLEAAEEVMSNDGKES